MKWGWVHFLMNIVERTNKMSAVPSKSFKALKDMSRTLREVNEFQTELETELHEYNKKFDILRKDLDMASDETSITMLPENEKNELRNKLAKLFHKRDNLGVTLLQTIEQSNLLKTYLKRTQDKLFPEKRPTRRHSIGGKKKRTYKKKN